MILELAEVLAASKTARPLPDWRPVDDNGRIRWRAPLSIDGATIEGLAIHANCIASEAGRDVAIILEYRPAGSAFGAIDRVDWKPSAPHSNKGIGPEEFKFSILRGSHRHFLTDNLTSEGKLRTGNLPVARPINEDLPTFESLVDFVARIYNIADLRNLTAPPWSEDLFS